MFIYLLITKLYVPLIIPLKFKFTFIGSGVFYAEGGSGLSLCGNSVINRQEE